MLLPVSPSECEFMTFLYWFSCVHPSYRLVLMSSQAGSIPCLFKKVACISLAYIIMACYQYIFGIYIRYPDLRLFKSVSGLQLSWKLD